MGHHEDRPSRIVVLLDVVQRRWQILRAATAPPFRIL